MRKVTKCARCICRSASNKTIRKSLAPIVSEMVDFVTQNCWITITQECVHVYHHANYNGAAVARPALQWRAFWRGRLV